jgi:hypothetical protein
MKEVLYKLSIIISLCIGLSGCTAGGGPGEVVTYGGLILLQDGTPLEGVEVTFFWPNPPNVDSDGTWIVVTDEDGWYSEWHNTLWRDRNFTITPFHQDYEFIPTSYSFEGSYESNLDLNFTAIPH